MSICHLAHEACQRLIRSRNGKPGAGLSLVDELRGIHHERKQAAHLI